MRCVVFLAVIGTVAGAKAAPITPPHIQPATRAMATVQFFGNNFLEASIDVASVELGEQGNGLRIIFSEGAAGGGLVSVGLGSSERTYFVEISDTSSVPYDDIVQAVDWIPEVTAVLRIPTPGATYDASLQIPPVVVLSGGADAVVPEPGTMMLTSVLGLLSGNRRRGVRFVTLSTNPMCSH